MIYVALPGTSPIEDEAIYVQAYARGVALFDARGLGLPPDRVAAVVAKLKNPEAFFNVDMIQVYTPHLIERVVEHQLYELRTTTYVRSNIQPELLMGAWDGWDTLEEGDMLSRLELDDLRKNVIAKQAERIRDAQQQFQNLFESYQPVEPPIDREKLS
jgi:hypothetical protein